MMCRITLQHCERLVSSLHFRRALPALYAGIAFFLAENVALAQTAWPTIALPENAHAFEVGEKITVNGLPMRIQGFVSDSKPSQLADWFRQSLGKPLVENTLGNKLILGRLQGTDYLTVQLEPSAKGTRGVVTVSHLKAAYDSRAETQENAERWLSPLPSGSRLISNMISEDAGKISKHLVISNTQSEEFNRGRLKNLLRQDGFEFERESTVDSSTLTKFPRSVVRGQTLYFKASGKEAMATISRDGSGYTMTVLNIITKVERLK